MEDDNVNLNSILNVYIYIYFWDNRKKEIFAYLNFNWWDYSYKLLIKLHRVVEQTR